MKLLLTLLVVFVAVSVVSGDEEGCTMGDHTWAVGTDYNPEGECNSYKCDGHNAMSAVGCAEMDMLPEDMEKHNCHWVEEDTTKPYPACCRHVKCDHNDAFD